MFPDPDPGGWQVPDPLVVENRPDENIAYSLQIVLAFLFYIVLYYIIRLY